MVRNHTAYLRLVGETTSAREIERGESRVRSKVALKRAIEAVQAHAIRTAEQHLYEPLRAMVLEHLETGGKHLRAQIALQATHALGGEPADLLPIAAACEILHNATLVHDDLQDGDTVRRGQPAVWVRHGQAQAINVGDVMLMLPTLAIEQSALAPSVRWHVASAFARRGVETAGGQSLELALLEQGWLARKPYLRAASGKSGPFFALPIEAAALATGRDAVLARALGDAALTLGALFQVRDDILDLFGDKGRGQVGNDLREGKVSALTVTHLEHCPQDRDALLETLRRSREETGTDEVRLWSRRFVKSGALARACAWASSLVEELVAEPNLALEPELRQLVVATAEKIAAPLSTLATD